ncbi:MAG: ParA family protein [Oligoflexia bacterium]|nr:ParA family protein [Oligoflexia bacterium]
MSTNIVDQDIDVFSTEATNTAININAVINPPCAFDKNIHYLPSDLIKLFGADKNTLLRKEKAKKIPGAIRIKKGGVECRAWTIDQLPLIGEELGFLKKIDFNYVISVFTLKGGTLKTSLAFQLARLIALHNMKVLVIGLDVQESITGIIQGVRHFKESDTWDEDSIINSPKGLYHALVENTPLRDVIQKTDLPTLDYIPETLELSILDRWLKLQRNQETIIKNKIVSKLKNEYNFVIFDCNPSWDTIVDNALESSNILLSPMTCSSDTYRAMKTFSKLIRDYTKETKTFKLFKVIPTRKKNTKVSTIIEAKFRTEYSEFCTNTSIRDSVLAEESNTLGKSLIELSYKQGLAQDYVDFAKEFIDQISLLEVEVHKCQ